MMKLGKPGITLTIAIPTYRREDVLLHTCTHVLGAMDRDCMELLVIDQSPEHEPDTENWLHSRVSEGMMRRVVIQPPSLTHARNVALKEALGDVVMFLDDDVIVPDHLFVSHLRWYENPEIGAVTGEVYNCLDPLNPPSLAQPGQNTRRHSGENHAMPARNISGGNHSVRKVAADKAGGYDEAFVGSALMEDLDFSQRLLLAGSKIWYDPEAWIIHLGVKSGGCGVAGVRLWPEWMHSGNVMLYFFRHSYRQQNRRKILWMALRNGPLRAENVKKIWRWPLAWWGFVRGVGYGWRHRRLISHMSYDGK